VIGLLGALAALGGVAAPAVQGGDRDAALLERHRDGDPGAFALIYARHADGVYRRLSRLLGPIAEREDLTQEVFLRLHQALPGFRGEAALATLIYRIVVNVACDHLRRRARRPTVPLDADALAGLVADEPTPEATARRRQELARVLAALDRIKPKKRIALLLRTVEGLTFEEIAEVVDATPDAAAKRYQHGLRELLALLARAEAKERG
jgi:RNA polymerase sigma-70 factor (ECF subfamily)